MQEIRTDDLRRFIVESYAIEGEYLNDEQAVALCKPYRDFLSAKPDPHERYYIPADAGDLGYTGDRTFEPICSVGQLSTLVVATVPGAVLRMHPGMDVRVGSHTPPPGGEGVVDRLREILARACLYRAGKLASTPQQVHCWYESLHPYMDGNGRSGRALWLKMMLERNLFDHRYSFLEQFYFQTLEENHR